LRHADRPRRRCTGDPMSATHDSAHAESTMSERTVERPPSTQTTTGIVDSEATSLRPTVDDLSEWSFPASDPPATWTWDVDRARQN
jgi:hypothetical protein